MRGFYPEYDLLVGKAIERYLDNNERDITVLINPKLIPSRCAFLTSEGPVIAEPLHFIPPTHMLWISKTKIRRIKI